MQVESGGRGLGSLNVVLMMERGKNQVQREHFQHQHLYITQQIKTTSESRQKKKGLSKNKQVRICTLLSPLYSQVALLVNCSVVFFTACEHVTNVVIIHYWFVCFELLRSEVSNSVGEGKYVCPAVSELLFLFFGLLS